MLHLYFSIKRFFYIEAGWLELAILVEADSEAGQITSYEHQRWFNDQCFQQHSTKFQQ